MASSSLEPPNSLTPRPWRRLLHQPRANPCPGPLRPKSTRAGISLQHSQGRGRFLPEDSSTAQPLCLFPGGGIETAPSALGGKKKAVNESPCTTSPWSLAPHCSSLREGEQAFCQSQRPITMTDSWSLEVMTYVWEDMLQPAHATPT
ncbi:hypothetical protein P7K49_036395 [Saguinus oedipus]|uniref:Uncharacterized protein n=1 Tax=Saguinus oedipus TaxID=9490 RepID=A0ABQ9TKJ1_SAGOE|nr:hypothetical protein P7K49_036395 [Saguinus oedipus]